MSTNDGSAAISETLPLHGAEFVSLQVPVPVLSLASMARIAA